MKLMHDIYQLEIIGPFNENNDSHLRKLSDEHKALLETAMAALIIEACNFGSKVKVITKLISRSIEEKTDANPVPN